ncbi:hypothetical protein GCM10010862_09620 [Devosia nitrariae]|uniref:Uncharacterized protein n=1 Tax=Devosia nitrariae TaxID=2071872 RepID=A0ABQ5W1I2_9HYPH|nr:hypothetical protein GCM10010862_09620 [Devosia nitrariae]
MGAFEELQAEKRFEIVDLAADGARRQVQFVRSSHDTQMPPDRLEYGQRRHRRQDATRSFTHFRWAPLPARPAG